MSKTAKQILKIFCTLLVCFVLFVSVDCVRLQNSKLGTKPIITVRTEYTDTRVTYHGLGYSIKYYVDTDVDLQTEVQSPIEQLGYGAEFRLFDAILIWAWVE